MSVVGWAAVVIGGIAQLGETAVGFVPAYGLCAFFYLIEMKGRLNCYIVSDGLETVAAVQSKSSISPSFTSSITT